MSERASQRFDVTVGVIVRYQGATEPCMSRSVSPGGMFIGAKKPYPENALLEVEIVHDTTRLRVKARVATVAKAGIGLEFIETNDTFHQQITALIAKFVKANAHKIAVNIDGSSEDAVVEYAVPDAEEPRGWFKRSGRQKSKLIDLSLDGAAIVAKKPPDVGTELAIFLRDPGNPESTDGTVRSLAKVVRHTDRGFAVQFNTPSSAFRRAASRIREAARKSGE